MLKDKKEVFQWDCNLKLTIDDSSVRYVDFGKVDPVRIAVSNGECSVPDDVMKTAGMKIFFLCRDDQTREQHSFTVHPRPIPPDYASTPAQRITFDDLVDSVNDAVDAAENVDVHVEQITGGYRVTFTDRDGVDHICNVMHGTNGQTGATGATGPQGPQGPAGATGPQGPAGQSGTNGTNGTNGQNGADGFSPMCTVEQTATGAVIYVTDADGTTTATIYNGSDASATDVQINGTSIVQNNIANINSYSTVKNALTDGIGPAWSSTEQAAARQRIGLDKEWVLKGTITDGTGVSLDLTGCTELIMYGTITTSATTNMTFNGSRVMFVGISNNNTRTILAKVESNYFGFSANAKTTGGTNQADIGTNLPGHDWRGFFINSITSIGFNAPANVTSCTIQIYAR